jgi:DNA-binding transcriptional LysR family regulator
MSLLPLPARFDERALNGISTFSAIVRSGSFARAGEILDMSQSGVSRALARLEKRLGIRLLDRTTRSVTLTDEGRRLYEQIVPLLAGLEEAAAGASAGAQRVRGRLRVNADPFVARQMLGPRLGAFMRRHPELQLEMLSREELGDMVAEGFDLAIRFGHPRPSSLIARPLNEYRRVTVASAAYLRRHGRPAAPAEIRDGAHVCILYRDPESGRAFPWEFRKGRQRLAFEPAGALVLNDKGTVHAACLSGYGIAHVLSIGIEPYLASGQLIDLLPGWHEEKFPLYAYYPSRLHPPAKTRAFLEFAQETLAGS